MIRKIISIICYVIAGFFLYAVCLLGFINQPSYFTKIAVMGSFSVCSLITLAIGLAFRRFLTWKRDVGIVLLTVAGSAALSVFSIFCVSLSAEFKEFFPNIKFDFSIDYITGLTCIITFAFIGSKLVGFVKTIFF